MERSGLEVQKTFELGTALKYETHAPSGETPASAARLSAQVVPTVRRPPNHSRRSVWRPPASL